MFPDAKPETVRWYLSIFNGYMKFYGNQTVQKMMLAWPQNVRTHIDWLSPQEAVALIRHAKGVERMVVHLELRLWFRRVEVRRLRTADIKEDLLDVRGKGRCGGKWRSVAWGPDTMAALMEWDREREAMVERAQKYDSMAEPPETWLFYQRGRKLAAYGDTAIDNIVSSAANRSGIDRPVTNHTLRRTGGRLAFYAGVSLEEICEGMGHSNTKQTIRYLGLQVDDLKRAQEKIYQYLLSVGGEMPPGMKLPTPGRRISR
jgi:integrase/recombinase XerD